MPYVELAIMLSRAGNEADARGLVEEAIGRLSRCEGFRGARQVRGRVGHGSRWVGWLVEWDDLGCAHTATARQELSDLRGELHRLSEPRACHEFLLEVDDGPEATLVETAEERSAGRRPR